MSSDKKQQVLHAIDTGEDQLVNRLDDWRRRQPSLLPRSEALRELMRRALQAEDGQHTKEHPA